MDTPALRVPPGGSRSRWSSRTDLVLGNDTKLVEDYKGNKLLLFSSFWSIKWVTDPQPPTGPH